MLTAICARDSITWLKMYYVCTFESFVSTVRVIIFLYLANVRASVHITVHTVTTYIPNVGLSFRYNFHAIRVLSATFRNSQTTYNRPKPSLPTLPRISGAQRGWRWRIQEEKRKKEKGGKKKQHWRQSRVWEKERKREKVKPLKEGKKVRGGFKTGKGEEFFP